MPPAPRIRVNQQHGDRCQPSEGDEDRTGAGAFARSDGHVADRRAREQRRCLFRAGARLRRQHIGRTGGCETPRGPSIAFTVAAPVLNTAGVEECDLRPPARAHSDGSGTRADGDSGHPLRPKRVSRALSVSIRTAHAREVAATALVEIRWLLDCNPARRVPPSFPLAVNSGADRARPFCV